MVAERTKIRFVEDEKVECKRYASLLVILFGNSKENRFEFDSEFLRFFFVIFCFVTIYTKGRFSQILHVSHLRTTFHRFTYNKTNKYIRFLILSFFIFLQFLKFIRGIFKIFLAFIKVN